MPEIAPDLIAYDTLWKNTPPDERNAVCEQAADDYVAAHPELRSKYGGLTIPQLVALVDSARERGDEAERIALDIWINGEFEYQSIGGDIDTTGSRRRELPPINVEGDRRGTGGL